MTVYYLDSSALIKRVRTEDQSAALILRLDRVTENGDHLVTSALAWVEIERAIRSFAAQQPVPDIWASVEDATAGFHRVPINDQILGSAGRIGPPVLRSLDAIHLASALRCNADRLITYDRRLAEAAELVGLRVESPA
ncbi:MAG: type II toxin-antitoxin system VapC family toxin [Micrococcales bacterium]|nr:type II toxin-antitoxin system VapC family toxin [Micrococcales bacterium]